MHGDFNAQWTGNHFDDGKFEMNQLRIEMKGQINDWLSYRYRQRLNTGDSPAGYRDNVLKSIDYAMIGVTVKKFQFFLGKQCAAYGGIDFDRNPIEIYQYPEMIQTWNNFLTGINVSYNITPRQQIQLQMLNSLTGTPPKRCMASLKGLKCLWSTRSTGTATSTMCSRPGGRHRS